MEPIRDFINRIKWDERENVDEYTFGYLDRIQNKLIFISYYDILRIEDNFMIIQGEFEEVNIPLHRIKKVLKNDECIWERKF
tara:strand:- start:250 stop:495 length:246 start_codon:yes stop_codon:yes gene_type:complete